MSPYVMTGGGKGEHVTLQVEELGEAAKFYEDVLGLAEITREDGTVYYGCGYDGNYDLAIREGAVGVDHIAVRVADADKLEDYEERLAADDVRFERTDGTEPGQERGLRFELPSHLQLELVSVTDKTYQHSENPAIDGRAGIAPVDLNHFNFMSPDVKRDAKFMRDVLDFSVSEAILEDWSGGAFLRKGAKHHDIAILERADSSTNRADYHHTAFSVRSADHMVQLIDRVQQVGVDLEVGIGRHHGGDNLYSYFVAPDGHRIELTAQMAELDEDTPTLVRDTDESRFNAWRDNEEIPASFARGSGLANQ